MSITLAKDGIFPIIKDENNSMSDIPASGLPISGTIQGEGKLSGTPSLFIRLATCNLHCIWKGKYGISKCDTAYAAYEIRDSKNMDIETIVKIVINNRGNINHIVITGGEPFLQAEDLTILCKKLKEIGFHITIETNATICNKELLAYVDLLSMSPKLKSSVPENVNKAIYDKVRINIGTIQNMINSIRKYNSDLQLKFVVANEEDVKEIECIVSKLSNISNEDILLMAPGTSVNEIRQNSGLVLYTAIKNNWRYCDRLHISLFGNKEGV